jgi:hypothetical protein
MLVDGHVDLLGTLMGNEHRHTGRIWPQESTGATRESAMHPVQREVTAVLPHRHERRPSRRLPGQIDIVSERN